MVIFLISSRTQFINIVLNNTISENTNIHIFHFNTTMSHNIEKVMETELRVFLENNKVNVSILTPCYGSTCFTQYVSSLLKTTSLFNSLGINYTIHFCNSDSLVPRARNNMIANAMVDPEMTHFIFIDADIEWNAKDILKLILADKGIIGGIYPLKHFYWERLLDKGILEKWQSKKESPFMTHIADEILFQNCLLKYNFNKKEKDSDIAVQNNIAEVRHIATGFMMIKREVIECMQKAFPSTKYTDDVGYLTENGQKNAFALFDCSVEDGHYYSEDWLFCQRWINMGGKIYANVSINLNHIGVQSFQGNFLGSII